MWCRVCQNDVNPIRVDPPTIDDCQDLRGCVPLLPAVSLSACPKCGTAFSDQKVLPANPPTTVPIKMQLMYRELDEQLSDVRRWLASQEHLRTMDPFILKSPPRTSTIHSEIDSHADTDTRLLARSSIRSKRASGISGDVWRIVLPGGAAFLFGILLLAWSVLSSRLEWWNVGLAAMLTGQSALLIAAILLVQNVRHGNRDLSAKIDATIGGLHVLRKEKRSVHPGSISPESREDLFNTGNLHQRFAEVKQQITKVQRSLAD